jgi:hypothetical protein
VLVLGLILDADVSILMTCFAGSNDVVLGVLLEVHDMGVE